MFSVTVVFAAIFSISLVSADDMKKCTELWNPENERCCDSVVLDEVYPTNIGCEKKKDSNEDWPCEVETCIMKKFNVLNDDETINDDRMHEVFDGAATQFKPFVDRIKQECLDGKYKKYGPKEVCEPVKFYLCDFSHSILECPKWKESEQCSKLKDLAVTCQKMFNV